MDSYTFTNNNNENETVYLNLDVKGAYIKFEFLSNFGEDYFCIQKIQFFADITHTINEKEN